MILEVTVFSDPLVATFLVSRIWTVDEESSCQWKTSNVDMEKPPAADVST